MSEWDVLYDGSDDAVSEFLAGRLGTPSFRLRGSAIELELPEVGKDRRPRPDGSTIHVAFTAPRDWIVVRPPRGGWSHVAPAKSQLLLCGIDQAGWAGAPQEVDETQITCPWCRVRLIAVSLATPPGKGAARGKVTLHDEIASILRDNGNGWMTTQEIAERVRIRARFVKGDGTSDVTAFQIHGRTWKRHTQLFERDGSRVRLRPNQVEPREPEAGGVDGE